MREYKLWALLGTVVILSLFGSACVPISGLISSTTASPAFTPAPVPTPTPSPVPPALAPIPALPAPTAEPVPGIATEAGHEPYAYEIDIDREITLEQEPGSKGQVNQEKTEVETGDELPALSELADGDKIAESKDEVILSDETNDEKIAADLDPAPDLIIESITWSPENPKIGDKVTVSVIIKNQGHIGTDYFDVAYYVNDTPLTSDSINPMDPDTTAVAAFTWATEAGSHAIKIVADSSDEVAESDETNNAEMFAFSAMAPDLTIQDITWSPASPTIRDVVTFTVTIKNQGSSRAVSSRVYLYIAGAPRGYQDVQRLAADATVAKTFVWVAQAGSHSVKAVVDGLNQVIENDETNNEKTVAYSTPAPDLTIQDITWSPANPSEGNSVTFTVAMKNQGNGKADYSHVAYYIDGTYLASIYVGQISPGATAKKTFTWTAQAGSHTIKAVADFYMRVVESDEANNEKTVTLSPPVPDLIVPNITWSPASPLVGDPVTFSVTIKNQGGTGAAASNLTYYIDGQLRGHQEVQGLAAGATVTKTFTWAAQPGSHTIKAVADSDMIIFEGNETNNEKTVNFSGPPLSDLIVQNIVSSPASPLVGDTVTFTVTIKNLGSGRTNYSYVACYIDDTHLTSVSVNPMAAGATATRTFTWTARAGSHTIKAVADFYRSVAESDETNNENSISFSPLAPDLVIQDITWSPASPLLEETATFTVSIINQGGDRAGSSRVYFYVDGALRGYEEVEEMAVGAIVTRTFPWIAQAGSHSIKAIADMENRVAENDENNNEKVVTLSISPTED